LDQAFGIAVDATGNAYVTGSTNSTDFSTTLGAFQTTYAGNHDAFVTKLNPTGSALVYSTHLGGSSVDQGSGIAVDATGNAYVTGLTSSIDFPTTLGAFQTTYAGNQDAFVTKLNPAGSALVYSTYLGGSNFDQAAGIAVDATGNAYVTGYTASANFPTTFGAFQTTLSAFIDAFVTKVNPTGIALVYSTYLGGNQNDLGSGIAVDATGNAYVTGYTGSTNFPTTLGAFQTASAGNADAFVTKISDVAPPATLTLTPAAATNPVNTQHCVTATVKDISGNPTPNVTVRFTVAGAVNTTGSATTNVNGQAAFCYTGPHVVGADTITAYADTNNNNVQDVGEPSGTATKTWGAGVPATLTLTPPTATNPVGSQHCVTSTVKDAFGNPTSGVTVRFKVTGSVTTSGSATTNANGQATFCYTGPALPGADAITAYADTNSNNTQDAGEPSGAATKTWALPVTTPLCAITITNGGQITADNGDKANFGGNAKADAKGKTSGQEEYQDKGPVQRMNVHSINVLAVVCQGTTQASIYGQATINGSGSFFYRINVQDLGEPGVGKDTYWMLLQNGYNSGQHKLEGGNIQIRRQ
jgi:hypothetical protein